MRGRGVKGRGRRYCYRLDLSIGGNFEYDKKSKSKEKDCSDATFDSTKVIGVVQSLSGNTVLLGKSGRLKKSNKKHENGKIVLKKKKSQLAVKPK